MKTIAEIVAEGQAIQDAGNKIVLDLGSVLAEAKDILERATALNADVAEMAANVPPSQPSVDPVVEIDTVTESGVKEVFTASNSSSGDSVVAEETPA